MQTIATKTHVQTVEQKTSRKLVPVSAISGDHGLIIQPELLDKSLVATCHVVPLVGDDTSLTVLAAKPFSVRKREELSFIVGKRVNVKWGEKQVVQKALREFYSINTIEHPTPTVQDSPHTPNITASTKVADDIPVVDLVNDIISRAIKTEASDIHIEPLENEVRVRYRMDGVLHNSLVVPQDKKAALISRLKILADLDIAEKRRPQDGRIRYCLATEAQRHRELLNNSKNKKTALATETQRHGELQKKRGTATATSTTIDIRVSTLPTDFGEKVVLRILDKGSFDLDLKNLGLKHKEFDAFKRAVNLPHGMVLVTGPTGSGKTTSLYSALNSINSPGLNIVTIEDPIEYNLAGINQSHVKGDIGYTFASALRSFLRQDPDVIMVGEIRDTETAEIGIRASLTGHLVLSTLHTNDAPSAVTRLLDMGLEPFLISSSVTLIAAQRLVRKICPYCRETSDISVEALKEANMDLLTLLGTAGEEVQFYRGRGCSECSFTGYKGRTGIFEILPVTPAIQDLIVRRATAQEIREQAVRDGMTTLRHDALLKLKEGVTSLDEVLRETSAL